MMNNRGHLPAGQGMHGGPEVGPGPGVGGGGGGGPRRGGGRSQPHHNTYYHNQHAAHMSQMSQPMYPNPYMAPYGGAPYYPVPQQYQNGGMPPPAYMPMPYPPTAAYNRSPPPPMQQYVPMAPQAYGRPPQHSPVVSSPYQPPPLAPIPHYHAPYAPESYPPPMKTLTPLMREAPLVSSQPPPMSSPHPLQEPTPVPTPEQPEPMAQPPAPASVQASSTGPLPEPPTEVVPIPKAEVQPRLAVAPVLEPFRPPLPWLSHPEIPFSTRSGRSRRRRRILETSVENVELPQNPHDAAAEVSGPEVQTEATSEVEAPTPTPAASNIVTSTPKASPAPKPSTLDRPPTRSETPSTQDVPSETTASTSPTTPSSVQPPSTSTAPSITPTKSSKSTVPRAAIPIIPLVPALPKSKTSPKEAKPSPKVDSIKQVEKGTTTEDATRQADAAPAATKEVTTEEPQQETAQPAPVPAPAKAAPTSWANLFSKAPASAGSPATTGQAGTNGVAAEGSNASDAVLSNFAKSNASSVAEVLQVYRVNSVNNLAFLEPRGLINTGNMCYMNSVLQVLLFCIPFYDFLDQVGKKVAYSFKSETPLLDAMIMFQREFNVIASAGNAELLRKKLKIDELERYGEPFSPDFIYDAIRKLPRFASMRRGHQQDAEEFLGFLLEGLHDECAQVIRSTPQADPSTAQSSSLSTPTPSVSSKANDGAESGDVWLEVGPKQRPAITRNSGHSSISSPITKIFGGQLRSELSVRGLKNSVTLEPYQPLQLDIGSPEVRNIVDALKGLTRPETLHGDFNSPHGKNVTATKTVFIESLPPVLILHLKRFQFDAEGHGTVKIWKKVGYPLELEIPREVLSRQKRAALSAEGAGLPKYRLIAAVYHHGKNASGGHYTVDVRRQDGREWIRIDDTVIRRVRSEDVAEGGEEDKESRTGLTDGRKDAAAAVAGHIGNRFGAMADEDTGDEEGGWNQVAVNGTKKYSAAVNGGSAASTSHPKAKQMRDNIRDNKVAYLLFYQRI
ncbi:cysteine proteinase [Coniochaeta ligniaria NRRL 30616]|uniref:ubiquitinyl hydrolase 1 n=1 Tax=Coniochaeta ligniaria NRRL 30616 TaxID=1408157 RepID=A0A1J7J0U1_9PEZI|nr:cysteine proteinase [Coniochaeta ligniaria NRRL 30616]